MWKAKGVVFCLMKVYTISLASKHGSLKAFLSEMTAAHNWVVPWTCPACSSVLNLLTYCSLLSFLIGNLNKDTPSLFSLLHLATIHIFPMLAISSIQWLKNVIMEVMPITGSKLKDLEMLQIFSENNLLC